MLYQISPSSQKLVFLVPKQKKSLEHCLISFILEEDALTLVRNQQSIYATLSSFASFP